MVLKKKLKKEEYISSIKKGVSVIILMKSNTQNGDYDTPTVGQLKGSGMNQVDN